MNTATIDGNRYILVPEAEYQQLTAGAAAVVDETDLPPWPKRLPRGNFPAVEYARVSLARKIITARKKARLSQAELARRAAITPAVLNRIERAKVSPDTSTIAKIEAALRPIGKSR